jgi:hypothetical protein
MSEACPTNRPSPHDSGLPPVGCKTWSARRKAAVVTAIRRGSLSRAAAFEHYMLSQEELLSWEAAYDHSGLGGLQLKHSLSMRRPTRSASTRRAARRGG